MKSIFEQPPESREDRSTTGRWSILPLFLCVMVLSGCVSETVSSREQAPGGGAVAPALLVERFLQAANANDIETMGQLFGTREGSLLERDPRENVEQRMFTLASLLRHDDYSIRGERVVPGRSEEAIQILTRLEQGDDISDVPFTVVRTGDGGWLVEQIDMDDLTRR